MRYFPTQRHYFAGNPRELKVLQAMHLNPAETDAGSPREDDKLLGGKMTKRGEEPCFAGLGDGLG